MSGETKDAANRPLELMQQVLNPRGRRYAGQPFDISSRHSIQIVTTGEHDPPIAEHASFAVVDYFYHDGRYWRARIPLRGIQDVFGQAFNFSKPKLKPGANGPEVVADRQGVPRASIRALNHVQSRFVFSPGQGIELYPLHSDLSGEPVHRVDDIVYSIEAVGPLGIRFNFRDGLRGNLIGAHRIMSTREMVFERIVVEKMHVLESPALPLDEERKRAALRASLLRSHRAGMGETYYLYRCCGTNNCTSSPFREIDRIANYTWRQRLGSLLYRLPLSPRLYLRMRGLDVDPSVRRLLRDEFSSYINDPETIRRRREFVRSRTQALRAARDAGRT